MKSLLCRAWRSKTPRRPSVMALLVLACSSPMFCGEIHDAALIGDLARVRTLFKSDPNLVFAKDSFGATPLHLAGAQVYKDVAELLLVYGADVNARYRDDQTPLHSAVRADRKISCNGRCPLQY